MYYYITTHHPVIKLESSCVLSTSSRFDIDGVWPAFLAVSAPPSQPEFLHCVYFGMQLHSVCVSRRLLSDVSITPVVRLYSEILYVRVCIIKLLQKTGF